MLILQGIADRDVDQVLCAKARQRLAAVPHVTLVLPLHETKHESTGNPQV